MPKKKKSTKKKVKKAKKKEKQEDPEESELEEDVSKEEIEKETFAKFTVSNVAGAPVLEKIADAPETPAIDWGAMNSKREETEKKKSDYEFLEEAVSEDYKPSRQVVAVSTAPVLRTERIDTTKLGRGRTSMGREFHMVEPTELQHRDDDYEPIHASPLDKSKLGKEREQVGRKYKPKGR